jgi:hypothetical protein
LHKLIYPIPHGFFKYKNENYSSLGNIELRHLLGVLEVQSPSSECLEDNAVHWGRLASGPPVSDTGEEQGHMSTDQTQTQTQTLLLLAQCKTC